MLPEMTAGLTSRSARRGSALVAAPSDLPQGSPQGSTGGMLTACVLPAVLLPGLATGE